MQRQFNLVAGVRGSCRASILSRVCGMDPIVEAGEYFSGSEDTSAEDRRVRLKVGEAPLSRKMSAPRGGFHFGPLKFGGAAKGAKPRAKRAKKQGPLATLEATMGSFLKISLYECFFTEGVWNAPPDEAGDTAAVLAEKAEIARLLRDVALFKKTMGAHVRALCCAMRDHIVKKVGGNAKDPLVVFFEQMLLHNELHIELARKPPVITKDHCVYDVWTGEVYNIDQIGGGGGGAKKRKKGAARELLTLVPADEGCAPFSVVCDQRGAWVLTAMHNLMHFQSYVVAVIKCKGTPDSGGTFNFMWGALTGKHALKPVNKWAWTNGTPFVVAIMSLYKTLVTSFTILRDLRGPQ